MGTEPNIVHALTEQSLLDYLTEHGSTLVESLVTHFGKIPLQTSPVLSNLMQEGKIRETTSAYGWPMFALVCPPASQTSLGSPREARVSHPNIAPEVTEQSLTDFFTEHGPSTFVQFRRTSAGDTAEQSTRGILARLFLPLGISTPPEGSQFWDDFDRLLENIASVIAERVRVRESPAAPFLREFGEEGLTSQLEALGEQMRDLFSEGSEPIAMTSGDFPSPHDFQDPDPRRNR